MTIRVKKMGLFYSAIALTILSNVIYHITQKLTPSDVPPMLALAVTYGVALLVCLIAILVKPPAEGFAVAFRQLNWASFGLGLAIIGLELGYLLAYRAGWEISLAGMVSNSSVALLLIPVGMLFFKEKITPANLIGVAVCVVGLMLINKQ
jgi:drug/metabolite transporter (DMT)-like permease